MNNNYGMVNINRIHQFKGSLIKFDVYIDNQFAGSLKNGETLNIPVYYGNHMVSLKTIDETVNQQVLLSDNQRNFNIECNCKMGLLTGRPNITNCYYN